MNGRRTNATFGLAHLQRWTVLLAAAALLAAAGPAVVALSEPDTGAPWLGGGSAVVRAKESFSYADYAAVLRAHVDDAGMVDYRQLKANRPALDSFVRALGSLDPGEYREWDDKAKIAFWTNAYNALTLKAIIDHYPIKASGFSAWRFPKNSIRQIPGVWKKLRFTIMGAGKTLDSIEHKVLRKEFHEPRIHVALVCAAMGCPPLRNEPYVAGRLDEQLDDQARRFLAHPEKFRIDRTDGKVHLSSIFKWFGADFVKRHGTDEKFTRQKAAVRAVLNFASAYLNEADRRYLEERKYSISYLAYDWTLNEQRPAGGDGTKAIGPGPGRSRGK